MKVIAIIPARYASTRLPGKPLKQIQGIPMIEHVYKNVTRSQLIDEVWVATDDERISLVVSSFGGRCIMTSSEHQTGTDRLAEAIKSLAADLVINVQGDEPLIQGTMLDDLVRPFLENPALEMATFKSKIENDEDVLNPNIVKVITNDSGNAIYFSRSPIPYNRDNRSVNYYKHIGVYAYKTSFLKKYVNMPQSPLELAESLEQLRALENGTIIRVIETDFELISVDTPEDLQKVSQYLDLAKEVGM
ncbi:3-deoxy-manno-octulosonate cytidylyltransferase [Paenibacillus apis]|uniref:3-deoxy-manno-octulosonate cytidylyltransferase n=1 Tax=Paenibacillus apis TaxID=1792174 RepID=A0A919Y4D7_9BACL|nr:3-deoxy-manno-octulosonate cytidylyltransferase [Paenibacillus apis]GIO41960.1 3-deoxy-manno-octulosonate cytidylyltransferase [Paenibacillus apis]